MPSPEVLTEKLERRVSILEAPEDLERRFNRRRANGDAVLEKRYNTLGVPKPQPVGNTFAESGSDEVLAAQALPVTPANSPPANNSLGLDIE